jgi:hypothetical protein
VVACDKIRFSVWNLPGQASKCFPLGSEDEIKRLSQTKFSSQRVKSLLLEFKEKGQISAEL